MTPLHHPPTVVSMCLQTAASLDPVVWAAGSLSACLKSSRHHCLPLTVLAALLQAAAPPALQPGSPGGWQSGSSPSGLLQQQATEEGEPDSPTKRALVQAQRDAEGQAQFHAKQKLSPQEEALMHLHEKGHEAELLREALLKVGNMG